MELNGFLFKRLKMIHIEQEKQDFFPKVEIKDYNVLTDGQKCVGTLVKNNIRRYENIRKIATGQEDDDSNGCLLDYPYFKESYELLVLYLSKQRALDVYTKSIQQISFIKKHEFVLVLYAIPVTYYYKMTQFKSVNVKLLN